MGLPPVWKPTALLLKRGRAAKDIRASREKAPRLFFWQLDSGREVIEAHLKEALGVSRGFCWDCS